MTPQEKEKFLAWANTPDKEQYGPFGGNVRAGVANYLGGYGNLGAALGLDTQAYADRKKAEADEILSRTSGPKEFADVHGPGDFVDYLKSLAGMSLPYSAEAVVAGLTGGLSAGTSLGARAIGTRAAGELAAKLATERAGLDAAGKAIAMREIPSATIMSSLDEAAKSLGVQRGAMGGMVAGTIPSAAGDIAQNQYEEAKQYNLPAILAGAPAYAALNLLGPEALAIKGLSGAGRFLPSAADISSRAGLRGAAERAALGVVAGGTMEGVGETGQEVINQMGRMAVNPNASLTSPDALHRYYESFIGGAALGGTMSGVGGAFTKPAIQTPSDMADRVTQMHQNQEQISLGNKIDAVKREDATAVIEERDKAMRDATAAAAKTQAEEIKQVQEAAKKQQDEVVKAAETAKKEAEVKLEAKATVVSEAMKAVDADDSIADGLKALVKIKLTDLNKSLELAPPETHETILTAILAAQKGKRTNEAKALRNAVRLYSNASATVAKAPSVTPIDTGTADEILNGVPDAPASTEALATLAGSKLQQPIQPTPVEAALAEQKALEERRAQWDQAERPSFNLSSEPVVTETLAPSVAPVSTRPEWELASQELGVLEAKQNKTRADLKRMDGLRAFVAANKAKGDAVERQGFMAPEFELTAPSAPEPEAPPLSEVRATYNKANEQYLRALDLKNPDYALANRISDWAIKTFSKYDTSELNAPDAQGWYRSPQGTLDLVNVVNAAKEKQNARKPRSNRTNAKAGSGTDQTQSAIETIAATKADETPVQVTPEEQRDGKIKVVVDDKSGDVIIMWGNDELYRQQFATEKLLSQYKGDTLDRVIKERSNKVMGSDAFKAAYENAYQQWQEAQPLNRFEQAYLDAVKKPAGTDPMADFIVSGADSINIRRSILEGNYAPEVGSTTSVDGDKQSGDAGPVVKRNAAGKTPRARRRKGDTTQATDNESSNASAATDEANEDDQGAVTDQELTGEDVENVVDKTLVSLRKEQGLLFKKLKQAAEDSPNDVPELKLEALRATERIFQHYRDNGNVTEKRSAAKELPRIAEGITKLENELTRSIEEQESSLISGVDTNTTVIDETTDRPTPAPKERTKADLKTAADEILANGEVAAAADNREDLTNEGQAEAYAAKTAKEEAAQQAALEAAVVEENERVKAEDRAQWEAALTPGQKNELFRLAQQEQADDRVPAVGRYKDWNTKPTNTEGEEVDSASDYIYKRFSQWTAGGGSQRNWTPRADAIFSSVFTVLLDNYKTQGRIDELQRAGHIQEAQVEGLLNSADRADAARIIRAQTKMAGTGWNAAVRAKLLEMYADFQVNASKFTGRLAEILTKLGKLAVAGIMALTIAFSPTVAQRAEAMTMPTPTRVEVLETITSERPRADFQGVQAGSQVRYTADWMVRNNKNKNLPFILVDKQNGFMFAFDAGGKLYEGGKSPAITGKARADALTTAQASKGLNETTDADKVTEAGIYEATGANTKDYGQAVVVKQYDNSQMAIHTVYLGTPSENRAGRLQSANSLDKRISYGCINAPASFINDVIAPHFAGKSIVVVLPEMSTARSAFNIIDSEYETTTVDKSFSYGATEAVGNEERDPATGLPKQERRAEARSSTRRRQDNQPAQPSDPTVPAWVNEALTNPDTNSTSLLREISQDGRGTSPLYKILAEALLSFGVGDINLVYSNTEGKSAEGERIAGSFDAVTNTVTIYRGGENIETILHEYVHSVTTHLLDRAEAEYNQAVSNKTPFDSMTKEQQRLRLAYERMTKLYEEARAVLGEDPELKNAFKTLNEFVTEALTNRTLQNRMMKVQSEVGVLKPSVWRQFINAMKDFLGLDEFTGDPAFAQSVLARVLEGAPSFLGSIEDTVVYSGSESVNYQTIPGGSITSAFTATRPGVPPAEFGYDAINQAREKGDDQTSQERTGEWMRRGKEMLSDGISHFNNVRYVASRSFGYSKIYDLAETYNSIKLTLQTVFNAKLARLMAMPKASRDKIGKYIYYTTIRKGDGLTPSDVMYYMQKRNEPIYEEQKDGTAVAVQAMKERGMFSEAELKNVQDSLDGKPMPQMTEAEYKAYKDTMEAMMDGAASLYYGEVIADAESTADYLNSQRLGIPNTDAGKKVDELVANLRKRVMEYAEKNIGIDPATGVVTAASDETIKKLIELDENLYGVITANANDTQMQQVAQALDMTADELRTAAKDINDGAKSKAPDRARRITNSIMISGLDRPQLMSQRIFAVESILGGYAPLKRYGKYIVNLSYKDGDGNLIPADQVDDSFAKLLPIYADDDLEFMKKSRDFMVDTYKDVAYPILLKNGEVVENATIEVGKVEAKRTAKRVSDRIQYREIMRALDKLGIKLSLDQRTKAVKATTDADSAVRQHLKRVGRPGASEDFVTAVSEDLSRRSALIAARRIAPQMESVMTDVNGEYWGDGTAQIAKMEEALASARAGGNKALITIAEHNLSGTKRLYEAQQGVHRGKPRDAAQEFVTWFFKEGGSDDSNQFASQVRSVTTVAQIGLAFASAVTNLTSLPLHALSGLATYNDKTGFGGGFGEINSAKALIKAVKVLSPVMMKSAAQLWNTETFFAHTWLADQVKAAEAKNAGKKVGEKNILHNGYSLDAWKFIQIQSESGVTAPQNVNAMMGSASKKVYGSKGDEIMGRAMALFAATEEMNRMATLLASYELYNERAAAAGMSNTINPLTQSSPRQDYVGKAAVKMVFDTQGAYSQANRPKLFRSGVMSMVYMYKTFAVTTLELLRNLPPRGRLLFLGILHMFSGAQGIPLFEELITLIDIISQRFGMGNSITKGNAERELNLFLKAWGNELGVPLDKIAMHGILDTMTGTKFFGRAGVNVGIPFLGLGRAGADVEKEFGKALGAPIGAVGGTVRSLGALARGDFERAAKENPVTGLKNFADAYLYYKYDNVLNKRGQIVIKEPTAIDIGARALGFYPEAFFLSNDKVRLEEYSRAYAKELSSGFIQMGTRAAILRDTEALNEVRALVREHNDIFKGTELYISEFNTKLSAATKLAKMTLAEREIKSVSKAQRPSAKLLFEEN